MKPALLLVFKNTDDRDAFKEMLRQDAEQLGTDALVTKWKNTEVNE